MGGTGALKSVTELKAGLSFLPVEPFYLLVLSTLAGQVTLKHLSLTANDRANVLQASMDRAEAVLATAQRHLAVVLAAAWVTDAHTICYHDRAFAVNYFIVLALNIQPNEYVP